MVVTLSAASIRRKIRVRGIVQGVGFRPFVYNLAHTLALNGYVLNSSSGVIIEIEGPESALDSFLDCLKNNPPALARIEDLTVIQAAAEGDTSFVIRDSLPEADQFVLVSPDVATCADCWDDVCDARNRRYQYPFTNCTNCGPRCTIIRDIPYDRPLTTMSAFSMCSGCRAEYHDPANRRFHAQPNACPVCGPAIVLTHRGDVVPAPADFAGAQSSAATLRDAVGALRRGEILAIKGLGGFQLACDASNDRAVHALRERKKRSDKPFALMARDIASVEKICELSPADRPLLLSPQRPIVILRRRAGSGISMEVAPGNNTIGVMLPYTPLHHLLFRPSPDADGDFTALVMTSGNISDEPIVISNQEAGRRLERVADHLLFHNRDIHMRVDDSVARTFEGQPRILRRSRGYVPHPIDLGAPVREILACGAGLKNTFCLTKDRYAILSQHIGDLENVETLDFFRETLANLKTLFRVEPQAVAYDLHPQYLSSRFAQQIPELPKVGVQHHHAHIASCMAENALSGSVIGVAFDGIGYGTDGQIWGGEFLVASLRGFERRAHLRYIDLPGGDAAVRQPWRVALSYLRDTFGADAVPDLPLWRQIPPQHLSLVSTMLQRRINTVMTSSCGRLFDAVAALIGLRSEVNFEGQAAIELEAITQSGITDGYCFDFSEGSPWQLDMRPLIAAVVRDLRSSVATSVIASRFHNTVASAILEVCRRIRASEALDRVCLSGGTFQNMYLLERVVAGLRGAGFHVFLHSQVPPNDGGISLGQAVVANQVLQHGA
jgi:hydrogenase maturation protein HypF